MKNPTLSFLKKTVAAQIHLAVFLFAIGGSFALVSLSANYETHHVLGTLVFSVTSMLVFGISAFYHFWADGFQLNSRQERILENLDQSAIYLFIAGTQTPFFINAVSAPWGETLIAVVWTAATLGIIYTFTRESWPKWAQSKICYTIPFVILGWTPVFRIGEIISNASSNVLFFLACGCLSYTIGAVIYASEKPNLKSGLFGFHELWHCFSGLGFIFHYFMILQFY